MMHDLRIRAPKACEAIERTLASPMPYAGDRVGAVLTRVVEALREDGWRVDDSWRELDIEATS